MRSRSGLPLLLLSSVMISSRNVDEEEHIKRCVREAPGNRPTKPYPCKRVAVETSRVSYMKFRIVICGPTPTLMSSTGPCDKVSPSEEEDDNFVETMCLVLNCCPTVVHLHQCRGRPDDDNSHPVLWYTRDIKSKCSAARYPEFMVRMDSSLEHGYDVVGSGKMCSPEHNESKESG